MPYHIFTSYNNFYTFLSCRLFAILGIKPRVLAWKVYALSLSKTPSFNYNFSSAYSNETFQKKLCLTVCPLRGLGATPSDSDTWLTRLML